MSALLMCAVCCLYLFVIIEFNTPKNKFLKWKQKRQQNSSKYLDTLICLFCYLIFMFSLRSQFIRILVEVFTYFMIVLSFEHFCEKFFYSSFWIWCSRSLGYSDTHKYTYIQIVCQRNWSTVNNRVSKIEWES